MGAGATTGEQRGRTISVVATDAGIAVVVDGSEVASATSWEELSRLLEELADDENPLLMRAGDRYVIDGSLAGQGAVLSSLLPGAALMKLLDECEAANEWREEVEWRMPPYDVGLHINDARWGWVLIADEWRLVPFGFHDSTEELLAMTLHQTASMTGIVVEAGCVVSSPLAMSWVWDGVDGLQWFQLDYGQFDPTGLVLKVLDVMFAESEPSCVEEFDGWVARFNLASAVPREVIGAALARVWQPCQEHEPDWRVELVGHWWSWRDEVWVPADAPA